MCEWVKVRVNKYVIGIKEGVKNALRIYFQFFKASSYGGI